MYFIRYISAISFLLISVCIQLKVDCKESCYNINLIHSNWTDDRPRFIVNMTFSNKNGIGSITTINNVILSPVSSLLIIQHSHNEKPRIIYNVTTKLCDLQSIFNAVPLFKPVKENMLKQSNYTFSCPLNKGVYVMNNMRINPRNPLLGLMYQVKGIFTVQGGLFEEMTNRTLYPLSTYYITGRILRKNCRKIE